MKRKDCVVMFNSITDDSSSGGDEGVGWCGDCIGGGGGGGDEVWE